MEQSEFHFPNDGWHFAYSDSYGADELYHGLRVVEKIFPETEKGLANATYEFLKRNGIETAIIMEIEHVTDHRPYFYVFAERTEMLAYKDRLFPGIHIIEKPNKLSFLDRIMSLFKKMKAEKSP